MKKTCPLGLILEALRKQRGLTQLALSNRAGVAKNCVFGIESGTRPNPRWSTVQALADALEVSTDALRTHQAAAAAG